MSVCLSVCLSVVLASIGWILKKFDFCIFQKCIKEIQVSLKSNKNKEYFT
jgi:hypothetical protein